MIQLFGRYTGTSAAGPALGQPLHRAAQVSTRIRNHETTLAKVNDADGNPIEIAAVVVWQVQDTAKALYGVDDLAEFVAIQTETAVRHIAFTTRTPATQRGRSCPCATTPRRSPRAVRRDRRTGHPGRGGRDRVPADPAVLRARDRPGHAAPAAGQRRGRRPMRIVEGAVGMVELALQRLRRRKWSSWTRSARRPWSPTCWSCCAPSRPPSRRQHRLPLPVRHPSTSGERKNILLRMDPAVHDALARWAADELRSTTAQIEFLLRRALTEAAGCRPGPWPCAARAARPGTVSRRTKPSPPTPMGRRTVAR